MPLISIFYTGAVPINPFNIFTALGFLALLLVGTWVMFAYSPKEVMRSRIIRIENVNHQYLPVYLGYFFVVFSIPTFEWFLLAYVVIVTLVAFSKTMLFNPFVLIIGFNYYRIETDSGITAYLLSRRFILKNDIEAGNLKRLNDITFLEDSQ